MNRKLPAEETEPKMNLGLGAAADANIQRALQIARDAHDAKVVRELRANLDKMIKRPGARVLDRDKALALLRLLLNGLRPATEVVIGRTETGATIVSDHPAMASLDEFIDAFADLKRGCSPEIFRPARAPGAPPLSTKQRKRDQLLLDTVEIVRRSKGYNKLAEAEKYLIPRLRAARYTRDGTPTGDPISRPLIQRLRSNSRTRKPLENH